MDTKDAGQHDTPREVNELMVPMLVMDDPDIFSGEKNTKNPMVPACDIPVFENCKLDAS